MPGRYLTVGLACALLHNAIVISGDRVGLHYAVSSLVSFAMVVTVGYRLHSGWTFPDVTRGGMSFARYAVMASGNYPMSVAGMFVLVDLLGTSVAVATPIVTVLMAAFNFVGSRWALRAGRPAAGASMTHPYERVTTIARPRRPDWLPGDAEITRALATHQSLYRFHKPRYQIELLKDLAVLLPSGQCRILDVGAGSGLVAEMIASTFPGKTVVAVDVTNRVLPTVGVPFHAFDGQHLPFDDRSFDAALVSNVLHHVKTDERVRLLSDILRVTGGGPIVIKDHVAESALDHLKLACLDFLGNAPFGGMVEARYLGPKDWDDLFAALQCTGELLPGSAYRAGLMRLIFPNRLEICLRVTTASRTSAPGADARTA